MKRFTSINAFLCTVIMNLTLLGFSVVTPARAADSLTLDADGQYDYAQQRYDSGAWAESIAEFNRFIHFFPDDDRVHMARYLTGMAYYKADRFGDAAAIFNAIGTERRADGLSTEAYFMLSRTHVRQGRTEQAMVDLHNLISLSTDDRIIDRARYELGWLHVDRKQWKAARHTFNQIRPTHQAHYQIRAIDSALSRHDRVPTKRPLAAGLLSIIPGGGQLYCGRYQDALAAFLVNAGLMISAWEAFDNELYALGGVISFVEFGFYSANIYGAISSAHKFNRDQFNGFRDTLYPLRRPSVSLSAVQSGIRLCINIDF